MNIKSITIKTETSINELKRLIKMPDTSIYCDGYYIAVVNNESMLLISYDNDFAYDLTQNHKVKHISNIVSLFNL